jgi:hypothetical protein
MADYRTPSKQAATDMLLPVAGLCRNCGSIKWKGQKWGIGTFISINMPSNASISKANSEETEPCTSLWM